MRLYLLATAIVLAVVWTFVAAYGRARRGEISSCGS